MTQEPKRSYDPIIILLVIMGVLTFGALFAKLYGVNHSPPQWHGAFDGRR